MSAAILKNSRAIKAAFMKRSSPTSDVDSSSGTTKNTIESNNNDFVVVDTNNGGEAALEDECDDELFLRLRREALQVAE